MARPIAVMRNKASGQALWELVLVLSVVTVLVSGVLFAAYFLYARAYLAYQAEQALYCLVERRPQVLCRTRLHNRTAHLLPWGELRIHVLTATPNGAEIRAHWQIQRLRIRIQRSLDLSWSKRRRSFRSYSWPSSPPREFSMPS